MTVVIAQLTDTHLRAPRDLLIGVDVGRALQDAVAAIVNLPVAVDAVLATGDLADQGDAGAYAHFQDCVAPIRAPIHAIPGNHDNASVLTEAMPASAKQTQSGDVSYAADAGPLRLVMLDTTVAGAAHGSLTSNRLDWLDGTLSAHAGQPTLLAMHHPPFCTGIPQMDTIGLHGGEALEAVLNRNPQVIAVVCGHVHRSIFTSYANRVASIAPSPAFAVSLDFRDRGEIRLTTAESPGFHLHVWSPDGGPYGSVATHRVQITATARSAPP